MMNSNVYWQLFLETGSPEAYLMFHDARRMEKSYVSQHEGLGGASHTVQ